MLKGRTGTMIAAIVGASVIAVAGCSSGGDRDGGGGGEGGGGGKAAAEPVKLSIAPANGTEQAPPEKPVTVKADNGKPGAVVGRRATDRRLWCTPNGGHRPRTRGPNDATRIIE